MEYNFGVTILYLTGTVPVKVQLWSGGSKVFNWILSGQ